MIIQIVRLRTELPEEELIKTAKERLPAFQAIPGLLQKFYAKSDKPGHFSGIYIWDSKESLESFRTSELAKSIPTAYKVIEAPDIEIMDVLFKLREE